MSKIVLFGAGKIAEEVYVYLTNDSPHEVVAFAVDGAYINRQELFGRPVVPFEELIDTHPPDDFRMFIAVGYQDLNRLRERKYDEAKRKGYELISYVCSRACNIGHVEVGENSLVLENTVIQPLTRIGSNVFLWSGNHVGHHAEIKDHTYLSGQVVIGGNSLIERRCFLGVNCTIGHQITIGEASFIGAGTLITKNVPPQSVHVAADTPRFRLGADEFLRLTKMK